MTGPGTAAERFTAEPSASEAVGDLLLRFGSPSGRAAETHRASSRRTGAPWKEIATHPRWSLAISPVTDRWRGCPFTRRRSGDWEAFLLGELYPIGSAGLDVASVDRWLRGGADTLDGHFALLVWSDADARWTVWTSPFGTLHLYRCSGSEGVLLGSSFADVAAVSRRQVDPAALRTLLRYGFLLGDSTHYRDVHILRPGTRSVLSASGELLESGRYWSWETAALEVGNGDPVERFDGVLREVVGDLTADRPIAVPISGGLDSRSTVAALPRVETAREARLRAFSYGYEASSPELAIAARVARARGLPFTGFTIEPYLFDRLGELTAILEGFQDLTLPRQAAVAPRLEADRVLAAHWGDVWLDSLPPDAGPVDAELADRAFRKPGADRLLAHFRGGGGDGEPLDRLREEWGSVAGIESPDLRFKAFKTDQWSFRWTLTSLRAYQGRAFPRLPFYDRRLARLLLAIDTARLRGRELQIEHLRRYAPDLARIKWEAYDANLYRYRAFDSWLLPKRALARAGRAITGRRRRRRNWEVQFGGAEGRAALSRYLLAPERPLHEWFAPDAIRDLIDDLYRHWPEPGLGYAAAMLVSLGSWLDER